MSSLFIRREGSVYTGVVRKQGSASVLCTSVFHCFGIFPYPPKQTMLLQSTETGQGSEMLYSHEADVTGTYSAPHF